MKNNYQKSYHRLDDHWWRSGRRDIVLRLARQLRSSDEQLSAIDVGCGSGDILQAIASEGIDVTGVDVSVDAVTLTRDRGHSAILGDATTLGFDDNSFDILIASDVLEHLSDETAALREWARVLNPGGHAIIFVPAWNWLWCSHDEINNHQRRYRAKRLAAVIKDTEFVLERISYWNLSTAPLAIPVKLVDKLVQSQKPQVNETPDPFNSILSRALQLENSVIDSDFDIPFGISVFAIARIPE